MASSASTSHPGDDYYVSPTGTIQQQSNPAAAAALKLAGYVGPYDWADAKAKANQGVGGKIGQAVGAAVGDDLTGGVSNQGTRSGTAAAGSSAGNAAQSAATSWEQALQGFISGFESSALWIRVAKVAIGGTILIVGLAKLTGADKAVGGVVSTAVKAAPLL